MKQVYVVTSGEYSDYHIEKVFTDPKKAYMFTLLGDEWDDRRVEVFDVDDCELNIQKNYVRIIYNYRYDKITATMLEGKSCEPKLHTKDWYRFTFTVPLSNERLYRNITRHGKNCGYVKKITQDTFAQWCYEHHISREELIRKEEERISSGRKEFDYPFVSSSGDFTNDKQAKIKYEVNERVATVLKQMVVDGKPLPVTEELQKIYDLTAEEVTKEHEQD